MKNFWYFVKKIIPVTTIILIFARASIHAADILISTPTTTPQTFLLNNQKLIVSSGGNLTVDTLTNSAAAISDNNNTGLLIQLDATSGRGIIATGNSFGAIEITGATILLSGAGGSTAINVVLGATISNTATSGMAINSNTTTNTALTITNAGIISVNNNASSSAINLGDTTAGSSLVINNSGLITAGALGTSIQISDTGNSATINNTGSGSIIGAIVLNNSTTINNNSANHGITGSITAIATNLDIINSAGTILGNINLGSNSSSSLAINGGTITGNVTMLNASQTLNFAGGSLAGAVDGLGEIIFSATNYTLNGNIGATSAVSSVTINIGDILDAAINNNSITTATLLLNSGSILNLGSGLVTGSIEGAVDSIGTVNFTDNYTLAGAIGTSSGSLAAITVAANKTLDANSHNIDASIISLNSGSALTLGSGDVVGSIEGVSDGVGAVTITENFNFNGDFGISSNSLLSLTITDDKTAIAQNNSINATTVLIGDSAILTLGSGTITGLTQGSADNKGTLNFTENNVLGGNLGSATNSLATISISDGKTVTANTRSIDANNILLGSGSVLTMTTGLIVGTVDGALAQTGTLNLNGTSTVAAGTFLGGTNGIAAVNVGNSGVITANESITANDVTIGNGGSLIMNNGKTVVGALNGSVAGYGNFTIASGTVSVKDNIGDTNSLASILIASGATMNFISDVSINNVTNISATNVVVRGNLNLGNSSHTINGSLLGSGSGIIDFGSASHYVSGSFSTFSGDIIRLTSVDVNSIGTITAGGTATISNGTKLEITIDPVANYIPNGTVYKIVSGGTGSSIVGISDSDINVNGTSSNKTGGLTFTSTGTSNDLLLNVIAQRDSPSYITSDVSAQNAAVSIDQIGASATGNLQSLQQYLDSSSTSDAQRDSALQSITPQTDNSQNSFTITTASVSTAQDRLQSLHQQNRDETCDPHNGRGIWIQEFGTIASQGSSNKWNGYDARSFGTAVGIDKEFFENTHLGLSLSYARSTIKSKPSPKTISLNTYQINGYGGKNFGQFYIDGILGFAWNDYYSNRSISSVGVVAKGNYSGQTYIARTEGGYVFDLGRKFTITPFNVLT